MVINRHATTIIRDGHRAVLVQRDFDFRRVAGDGLVNTVIQDLLNQVVGTGGIRVHARPFAHRLQPG